MADEVPKEKMKSRARSTVKYLGLCLAAGVILAAGALFFLRPYTRLEVMIRTAVSHHAPPGTTIGDVTARFPLNIVITDLVVPVPVQGREREIRIGELSGGVSVLPLLLGKLQADISADFFGGTLWLDIIAESPARGHLTFDARARGVDIGRLSEVLGAPRGFEGHCDADVEGELDGGNIETIKGRALVMGRGVSIPRLDLGRVILPANRDAEFTVGLSAGQGMINFDKLVAKGAAYDVSGKGTLRISEPFERSPLDCSFSMVFRQPPTITDEKFSGMGAEYLMGALVETGAEVFFNVSGTAGEPEAKLDTSSSIGSILKKSSRSRGPARLSDD